MSPSSVPGASQEEVQVQDTDYTTFALMLFRRQVGSQPFIRIHLLCEPLALRVGLGAAGRPGATMGRGRPALTGHVVFSDPRQEVGN